MTRGRRVPRKIPGAKKTPEGPGGRQAARRVQGDQKGAKLRVAKKAPSSLDCAGQSERESPVGGARCSVCGAVLDTQGCSCVERRRSRLFCLLQLLYKRIFRL